MTEAEPGRSIPPAVPSADKFRRAVAPRVVAEHSRRCALSEGRGRRCTCSPRYVGRVRHGERTYSQPFATLGEAVAWVDSTRSALRRGGAAVCRHEPAPPLEAVAVSFLHRARAGEALTRSRKPYGPATLTGYEIALRLRVLPHLDGRSGQPLGELPCDALDGRTAQNLVDVLAARESAASARVAAAALAAVLRDAYGRGLVDELPPRLTLPPPPARRERTLTLDEAGRLLEAAQADDARLTRSLLGPLVALLVGTGCRIGEALGLDWGPAGLYLAGEPPVVRIARSTTKTDAGARRVPLDAESTKALRRHFLASGRPPVGAPVFADEHGRRLPRHGRIRFGLERVGKRPASRRSAPMGSAMPTRPGSRLLACRPRAPPPGSDTRTAGACSCASTRTPERRKGTRLWTRSRRSGDAVLLHPCAQAAPKGTRAGEETPYFQALRVPEHFTRNEGVRGSSPRVGFARFAGISSRWTIAGLLGGYETGTSLDSLPLVKGSIPGELSSLFAGTSTLRGCDASAGETPDVPAR